MRFSFFPFRLLTMVLCAFICTLSAEVWADGQIILAVEDSWPPYADSEGQGLSTSIVRHALGTVGISASFRVCPYARVLFEVEKGIVDGGYNVTRQSSTEAKYLFGQTPILVAPASFYYRPDNIGNYHSLDEIPDGTRIGLIIDYEYGEEYEKQRARFQEVRLSSQSQIIQMLMLGRVDTVIMFDEVAKYTLTQMGLAPDTLVKGFTNHQSDIYVAFSRRNPEAEKLAASLDKGIQAIKANGVYEKIMTGAIQ